MSYCLAAVETRGCLDVSLLLVLVHLEVMGVRMFSVPLVCCPVEGKVKGRRACCWYFPSKSASGISAR